MKFWTFVFALCCGSVLQAQIAFEPAASDPGVGFRSGCAVVCIDINGDTYDDLVRLDRGIEVNVDLLTAEGQFFHSYSQKVADRAQWNLISADVNNDGWPDIVTSGVSDRVKVLTATPYTHEFSNMVLGDQPFFAQASNLVDVNGDQLLDVFVCNDDALNRLYINDGAGGFDRNDTLIDFRTVPASDNSGNYGSTWTDFDLDGDLDLYIAKCRIGVFDFEDPRRINMLFVNTDTGYVEMADSFGLAIGAQSWSADFGDIDNDGDFDIVVINHDAPSQLFENVGGGEYVDITATSGIDIEGITIQSIFRDFDNDGLVDLMTSGGVMRLYRNVGNLKFELVDAPFGPENVTSFTIGDYNNDGFPDLYATYNELYNTPADNKDDTLWLAIPNSNNYIRVKAVASKGDPTAVGAKLFLYGPWGTQIREIRAGESYGIGTALTQNFGLGDAGSADSLVIHWPSGLKETYLDLPVNETAMIEEGGCARAVADLDQGPFVQCGSDVFELNALGGYDSYLWSNGATTEMVSVTEPGLYHVSMTDAEGCTTVSAPILIDTSDDTDSGEVAIDGLTQNCFGTTVTLTAPEGLNYVWNNGATTQAIDLTESGIYSVVVTRNCFEVEPEPVELMFVDASALVTIGDTIEGQGSGMLYAEGDSVNWYATIDDMDLLGTGNTFNTPEVDSTTVYYADQFAALAGANVATGMPGHLGGSEYSGDDFNGGVIFDVFEQCTLDSVMVITEFPGLRRIVLEDAEGNELAGAEFEIDSGMHWLSLAFDIAPGTDYLLTTETETNNATFGVNSPRLYRSEEQVTYPYGFPGVIEAKNSPFGEEFYYYFYDWRLTTAMSYCNAGRVPVTLLVDSTSGLELLKKHELSVFPNPVSDKLIVTAEDGSTFGTSAAFIVTSINGQQILSGLWQSGQGIDVSGLVPGAYVLIMRDESSRVNLQFVKVDSN